MNNFMMIMIKNSINELILNDGELNLIILNSFDETNFISILSFDWFMKNWSCTVQMVLACPKPIFSLIVRMGLGTVTEWGWVTVRGSQACFSFKFTTIYNLTMSVISTLISIHMKFTVRGIMGRHMSIRAISSNEVFNIFADVYLVT